MRATRLADDGIPSVSQDFALWSGMVHDVHVGLDAHAADFGYSHNVESKVDFREV